MQSSSKIRQAGRTPRWRSLLIACNYSCESELRICFGSNVEDDLFAEAALDWHSLCDGFINFKPTTPVISTYSATPTICDTAVEAACLSAERVQNLCTTLTNLSALSSCQCQPVIMQNDFTCEYIGNVSCLAAPAATTNLIGYGYCSNFAEVIGAELTVCRWTRLLNRLCARTLMHISCLGRPDNNYLYATAANNYSSSACFKHNFATNCNEKL
jgi:hypothetical protein